MNNAQLSILYLMHVHWGWIKQRPHFIAEQLGQMLNVSLFYKRLYRGRSQRLVKNEKQASLQHHELFVLPFQRFQFIDRVNTYLLQFQLMSHIRRVDIVWITFPTMFSYIENILPHETFLVYDCMDDALEFPSIKSNAYLHNVVSENEKRLLKRANAVFVSSEALKNKLIDTYGVERDISVANNAIYLPDFNEGEKKKRLDHIEEFIDSLPGKKLIYIGSVSEWIDFNLIQESLEKYVGIVYILIGPHDTSIPKHDRLICLPPVEHQYVSSLMERADALLIPFKENKLIRSVNPVKIYEYIFSCKPVISLDYGEMTQFSDYIYGYRNNDEYHALIEKIISNQLGLKRNCAEGRFFVEQHTWAIRVDHMMSIISQSISQREHRDQAVV